MTVICSLFAALATLGTHPPAQPTHTFSSVVEQFCADEQDVQNKYWLSQSQPDRDRMQRLYTDTLKGLATRDFDALTREGQIDYLLLKTSVETRQRELAQDTGWYEKELPLAPFAPPIFQLEYDRRGCVPLKYEQVATSLGSIAEQVELAEKQARLIRPDRVVAYRTGHLVEETQRCLDRWSEFYHGYDPLFDWWIPVPLKNLRDRLDSYRKFLLENVAEVKEDDPSTMFGTPIGPEALTGELKGAMIDYSPQELIAIAEKEYAWSLAEMVRSSQQLGFGTDWKRALAHVRTLHGAPGDQPQLIDTLAKEAVKYVRDNKLVTVPELAEEGWTMEMMSPRRQYQSPFFTGGRTISVSFPTDEMSQEQKQMSLGANNRSFARATVFHELIPGHWLQEYSQSRYHTYRSALTNNPFWIEGWAFYWEMLLYSRGFASTPEEKIGMMFWRMHRSARVVFSIKFQLGEWSPQQCVDYLMEKVGHERFTAEGEVRRSIMGGYGPLYQLAYMMGALQFRELHRELVETGKMTDLAFHDAVLKENEMPIELVRATLEKTPLNREFQTRWRFYPQTDSGR